MSIELLIDDCATTVIDLCIDAQMFKLYSPQQRMDFFMRAEVVATRGAKLAELTADRARRDRAQRLFLECRAICNDLRGGTPVDWITH